MKRRVKIVLGCFALVGLGMTGMTGLTGLTTNPKAQALSVRQVQLDEQGTADLVAVSKQAMSDLGERFAGVEVSADGALVVHAVGRAKADVSENSALQQVSKRPVLLVPGERFSWTVLLDAYHAVSESIAASSSLVDIFQSARIDRRANRVIVRWKGDAATVEALVTRELPSALLSEGAITQEYTGVGDTEVYEGASDTKGSYPPAEAGKQLLLPRGYCSSGWNYYDSDTQKYFWATAGHCVYEGTTVKTADGDTVGQVAQQWIIKADIALIPIPAANSTNWIWTGVDTHVRISGWIPSSFMNAGVKVYIRGYESGGHGGYISTGREWPFSYTLGWTSPVDGVRHSAVVENQYCTDDADTKPGDSGGAAWTNNSVGERQASGGMSSLRKLQHSDGSFDIIGTCFAASSSIASRTGTNVWFS